MPWFPFTFDQNLKHEDRRMITCKDVPSLHKIMQTKIAILKLSTMSVHAHRERNGNETLLIDSATKNIMNWDYCYKFDYESNSIHYRGWCKIL